jgi:putative flippase GtrA
MRETARRVGGEAAKFTVVNIAATAVALLCFNLLVHGTKGVFDGPLHHYPLTGYVVANSIGMVISFLGSRHMVFKDRRPIGPGGGVVIFAIINLSSFAIPMLCLWFTRNVMHDNSIWMDNLSGNVIGGSMATLFRFWAFRRFAFKRHHITWKERNEAYAHLVAEGDESGWSEDGGQVRDTA